ncbi:MAG: S41 family peptidase [Phycisphaeraceae bacterium]|nr:S41 family peptidase [Phycisphaeraceae bacterium]
MSVERTVRALLAGCIAWSVVAPASLIAQTSAPTTVASAASSRAATDVANRVWAQALAGNGDAALDVVRSLPAESADPTLVHLKTLPDQYDLHLVKQAQARDERLATLQKELDEQLAKPQSATTLSEALKTTVEWYMLSLDKSKVLSDPRIEKLVAAADTSAKAAEAEGDWLTANELFVRLSLLFDEQGRYRDDVKRLGHRLSMLRLFVPQRFWEMRNQQRIASGKDPLPPYNALGEDYAEKLKGVSLSLVETAINRAAEQHVDRARIGRRDLLIGGLEFVRTMVTTTDLNPVFPGLADAQARTRMVAYLDDKINDLSTNAARYSRYEVPKLITDLLTVNSETVRLPETAVLREFGDGAMSRLDDFSAIIWPDDLARFERMYQGKLKGIGVQIQMDEATQLIKVVTPLEGTPAQRAGIRAGDLIKKIDGQAALGLSLNQAVELITGREGTKVNITMERDGDEVDFNLVRAVIPIRSVKGWKRTNAREDKWDWFVDPENKIGYIRLLQFQEDTTNELNAAVREMKEQGVKALVLDMRFNPGGLLTQAVSVANFFIDHGTIVSTTGENASEEAVARLAKLKGLPLAVLVNEGSASASEIVSGALKYYADKGDIRAVLIGDRTYGKGSVQNVFDLSRNAQMKLTTQYYKLPSGAIIHRLPGAADWGVSPHVTCAMLPEQISQSLTLRQDADVMPIDENGNPAPGATAVDPSKLLTDGIDLQLEYALVLLQTQTASQPTDRQARLNN